MDELFGLPAHPLLVHAPVVLVPLAAVGVILLLAWPAARAKLGVIVALIAVGGAVGAIAAASSGEEFEELVDRDRLVVRHADLGRNARWFALLFALAVIAYVVVERRKRATAAVEARSVGAAALEAAAPARTQQLVTQVLAVVMVVTAVLATVWITRTGHSGAESVWKEAGLVQQGP